ncbi:hypothetical protein PtA15_13A71 [Puccinia triticina]|uniref:Uncharacterized protein n=1 Tax=Puccinia triticina TaxID=208348 RepID=A0ABY7D6X7_9BASI|nr:uncharacterized protein PtA15_13A71 [Puccinia triticina]WAQ90672.1 hypothetical protein PtA15_13A71 [Puccinia triticina]
MCPADSTINLLNSNLTPSKPSDNPPSPIPTNPTSNSNKADPLPQVIPPTDSEESLTSLLDRFLELTPHNQSAASHCEEVAAATASINSLSPLSNVPSAPYLSHALDSPTNQSLSFPLSTAPQPQP